MNQKGFTLIELVIVISIIAILTAIAAVSYTEVQKGSRDSQRKSDLTKISHYLEVFYADNGHYPFNIIPPAKQYEIYSTNAANPWIDQLASVTAEIPRDPINNHPAEYAYLYNSWNNGQNYHLMVNLEKNYSDNRVFNGANLVSSPCSETSFYRLDGYYKDPTQYDFCISSDDK